MTGDTVGKYFKKAREQAGAYADMPPDERPTIHELRALGVHLYREAGFSNEYIMALNGHASERMLEHYAKDHAQKKPRLVRAGLPLNGE